MTAPKAPPPMYDYDELGEYRLSGEERSQGAAWGPISNVTSVIVLVLIIAQLVLRLGG